MITTSLFLSISSLLIISQCDIMSDTECRYLEKVLPWDGNGYPHPIGCYKNTQNASYGLYCESEINGTQYPDGAVVEYMFPAQDCPEGIMNIDKVKVGVPFNCSEDNCVCTEGLPDCDYMTIRKYDRDTFAEECITTSYRELKFVKDFCQTTGYGSYKIICAEDGEIDGWQKWKYKESAICDGELYGDYNPVGPTEADCVLTACSGSISQFIASDDEEDDGNTVGIVVAIVIILLLLIGCGVAYYCYRGRNTKRVQVGFDESADRGDLKNDEVGFYETNTYETNDRL